MSWNNHYTERVDPGVGLNTNPIYDISRNHAESWAIGVAMILFSAYIAGWFAYILTFGNLSIWSLFLCIPIAIIGGIGVGGIKLLKFTNEHRRYVYWYAEQEETALDFQEPVGNPPLEDYTMLRGIDGQYHRINTSLTDEEKRGLKLYLLMHESVTVRGLDPMVGNRATLLRSELITLGICSRPVSSNQAAEITAIGKKTVMRW